MAPDCNEAILRGLLEKKKRDRMDNLLEQNGFYRKHLPNDSNSLFRCISDCLYGTQKYHFIVKQNVVLWSSESQIEAALQDQPYQVIQNVCQQYNLQVDVITFLDESIHVIKLASPSPLQGTEAMTEAHFPMQQQFEPVMSTETACLAGIAQSILLELLYDRVFKLSDSIQGALAMLKAPKKSKAVLDLSVSGSAQKAYEAQLLPFSYKVAKMLDPGVYRNVEYDVYFQHMKPGVTTDHRSSELQVQPRCLSIADSHCLSSHNDGGSLPAQVLPPVATSSQAHHPGSRKACRNKPNPLQLSSTPGEMAEPWVQYPMAYPATVEPSPLYFSTESASPPQVANVGGLDYWVPVSPSTGMVTIFQHANPNAVTHMWNSQIPLLHLSFSMVSPMGSPQILLPAVPSPASAVALDSNVFYFPPHSPYP